MPAERITSFSPWHTVLVLDDSGSMEGRKIEALNDAIRAMVDEMKLWSGGGKKPYFRVSVISFGSTAKILSEAVGEGGVDIGRVTSLRADSGTTNAAEALAKAIEVLERNPGQTTHFEPFVFFFSDGFPDHRQRALDQGARLKALSLESGRPRLVTIGIGDADDEFMKELATSRQGEARYRRLRDADDIRYFFPTIGTVAASMAADRRSSADQLEEAIITI
jgi:uncharacterized protein YegL